MAFEDARGVLGPHDPWVCPDCGEEVPITEHVHHVYGRGCMESLKRQLADTKTALEDARTALEETQAAAEDARTTVRTTIEMLREGYWGETEAIEALRSIRAAEEG